jgi:hypothetical protein
MIVASSTRYARGGAQTTAVVHVDDLMVFSVSASDLKIPSDQLGHLNDVEQFVPT